jgi:DNA-binding beta-propeller fold protein YncE
VHSHGIGPATLTCVIAGVVLLTAASPAFAAPARESWSEPAGVESGAGPARSVPEPLTTSYPAGTIALGPPGSDPGPVAFDPQTGNLYVGEQPNTIAVVNASTGNLIGDITVASNPIAIIYNPTDGDLYVPLEADGVGHTNVSILDPFTQSVVTNIAVPETPTAAALDSTTGEVFVAVDAGTELVGILPSHLVATTFSAASSSPVVGLTFDATSQLLIAVGGSSAIESNMTGYDPSNGTVAGDYGLLGRALGVISEPGAAVEFGISFLTTVQVNEVSTPGWNTLGTLRIPHAAATYTGTPAYSSSSNRLLVPDALGLAEVNASPLAIFGTVTVGSWVGSVVTVNTTGRAWVSYPPYDLIEEFSPGNATVIGQTVVGGIPGQGTFDATTGVLFVPEVDADTIEGILPSTHTVVSTYPAGAGPIAVAYDPGTDQLFVADTTTPAVSVLSGEGGNIHESIPMPLLPDAIVDDPLFGTVFVALNGVATNATVPGEVLAINTTSFNVTPIESVVIGPGGVGEPTALAVNDVSGTLYIAAAPTAADGMQDAWVSEYSARLGRIVVNVSLPTTDPYGLAFDDVSTQLFVVWPDAIAGLSGITLAIQWDDPFLPTAPSLAGASLATEPQSALVFAGNSNQQVSVFNVTTGASTLTLQLSSVPGGAFFSPQSAEMYVAALGPDSVAYVHTATPPHIVATFHGSNIPYGKAWSVQLGQVASGASNGANLTVSAPPGAYRFTVTPPPLLSVTPIAGVVVLAGAPVEVQLSFNGTIPPPPRQTIQPTGPGALLSPLALELIGGLGAAALASGLLLAHLVARRRKEEQLETEFFSNPPQ